TGMIRASFAAVPRRLPVVFAKAVLMALITLLVMAPAVFAAFEISQAILGTRGFSASLSEPGVARAVFGASLYLTVVGVLGVALGWLLRSAAGAIATLVGVLVILPVIFAVIPVDWVRDLAQDLPSNAGHEVVTLSGGFGPNNGGPFSSGLAPWSGFAVFVAWTVAALALAAYAVKRRDA